MCELMYINNGNMGDTIIRPKGSFCNWGKMTMLIRTHVPVAAIKV